MTNRAGKLSRIHEKVLQIERIAKNLQCHLVSHSSDANRSYISPTVREKRLRDVCHRAMPRSVKGMFRLDINSDINLE